MIYCYQTCCRIGNAAVDLLPSGNIDLFKVFSVMYTAAPPNNPAALFSQCHCGKVHITASLVSRSKTLITRALCDPLLKVC